MCFNEKSKLLRWMERPIKVLARALDLYVRNMSSSGSHVFYGSSMSCPTPQLGSLPRDVGVSSFSSSYSTTSSDEYLRRSIPISRQGAVAAQAPRSRSSQIGPMDEYKCREFGVGHVLEVVHPKGIRSAAKRRRKIASVDDRDFTTDIKFKRI